MDRWLTNNNVAKVVALLMAVMLWGVVHLGETGGGTVPGTSAESSRVLVKELKVRGLSETAYLSSIERERVDVRLSGPRWLLLDPLLAGERVEAYVDVQGLAPGTHRVPVRVSGVPEAVRATVSPDNVWVAIEEKKRRTVPVSVQITGEPAEGFAAETPTVHPTVVTVSGPKSLLERLTHAQVYVDVSGADKPVEKRVSVHLVDRSGNIVDVERQPQTVTVTVPILPSGAVVPVRPGPLEGKPAVGFAVADVRVVPERVRVYGPEAAIRTLSSITTPPVNVDQRKASFVVRQRLSFPPGVSGTPDTVEVRVTIVSEAARTLQVPLTVVGGEGKRVTLVEPAGGKVAVVVRGAPDAVAKVAESALRATVNAGMLDPGRHRVVPTVTLPDDRVLRVDPLPPVTVLVEPDEDGGRQREGEIGGTERGG